MGFPSRRSSFSPSCGLSHPPPLCERVDVLGHFCRYKNSPKCLPQEDVSPVSVWFASHKESIWKNWLGNFACKVDLSIRVLGLTLVALSVLSILLDFGQPEGNRRAFHTTEEGQIKGRILTFSSLSWHVHLEKFVLTIM